MSAVLKGILFLQFVITAFKKGGRIDEMIVTIVAVLNRISQCGIILVYLSFLQNLLRTGVTAIIMNSLFGLACLHW